MSSQDNGGSHQALKGLLSPLGMTDLLKFMLIIANKLLTSINLLSAGFQTHKSARFL